MPRLAPVTMTICGSCQRKARERDAVFVLDFQLHRPLGRDAGFRIDDVGDQARAFVELDQRDVVGQRGP